MEEKKFRMSLSRKMAVLVTVFTLALSAALIAMSYFYYRNEMMEDYERFAMNIGAIAASQLNPDKIQGYLESGEADEEYERAYRTLCQIRENGGVEYLYVVKPELEEVWYVLDTDQGQGAIPLGFHEPYYEGAFAENADNMARGERIDPIISNEEYGWLMSVYYPLRTSAGEPAGYVGVDILMNEVKEELHTFAVQMIILMLILSTVFLVVMIVISHRMVTNPIRRLSSAAGQLVEAEQSGEAACTDIFSGVTVRSRDEIGDLYRSLSQMEKDMNVYIRDSLAATAKNERISAELSLANRIQSAMLPHVFPPFPDREEFSLYATMDPAREVGGDFYDFFLVDEDHLGLVMADVSGKGVPAALFMMIAKTILQSCAMLGRSPAEILSSTNTALCSNNQVEMFVTAWVGILEVSTGRLTAANAGHEYPVLQAPGGSFELLKDRHGLALGCIDSVKYTEYELQLQPGSRLFVYTDGVPEASDVENNMFGKDRMLSALNELPDAAPEQILRQVRSAVDAFVKDAEQFDDMTMLCLEYSGAQPKQIRDELVIDASVEKLGEVLDFIGRNLEAVRCSAKVQSQIAVAAEEIFVNIAQYAYAPGTGDAVIRMEASESPHTATITFMDSGLPFNPLAKADPDVTLPAEKRRIGGLGIFMTKKLMDDVTYEYADGRNVLTLRKNL